MSNAQNPSILIEEAVLAGGRAIFAMLDSGAQVEASRKADNSLVLNLDIISQQAMQSVLSGAGVLVSEEDPASHSLISTVGSYFTADPLDGTSSCRRSLVAHGKFVPGQIGFGPIAGYVQDGRMMAGAFFNLPDRMLYTAVRGQGAFVVEVGADGCVPKGATRCRINARAQNSLTEAAVLFYPGTREEIDLAYFLKSNRHVDALYRFGSFASDCTRVARGFEQIEIQFAPRAWDLASALLATEAGCVAILEPLGRAIALQDWEVALRNPICIVAPGLEQQMRQVLTQFKQRSLSAGV